MITNKCTKTILLFVTYLHRFWDRAVNSWSYCCRFAGLEINLL